MRFDLSVVPDLLPINAETPRSLVVNPPLTDAEFEALALASEWFRYERTREGEILMHPPAGDLPAAELWRCYEI
jgi:hypothetical protein